MTKGARIVILSMTNISFSNATGSLMYRLFCGFNPDNILQVTKYFHKDRASEEYNNHYPFYDFMEKHRTSKWFLVKLGSVFLRTLFFPFRYTIGNKKDVLNIVRDFEPDVIYLRVVGIPMYFIPMALYLQKELKIPLVCHFMDDYELRMKVEGKYNLKGYLDYIWYRRLLKKLLLVSSINFAISDSMAEAFKKRYGKTFTVVHNGVEKIDLEFYQQHRPQKNDNFYKILWAGSIDPAKDDIIVKAVIGAVEKINNSDSPTKVRLLLNVPEFNLKYAQELSRRSAYVDSQSYLPRDEYRQMLANADLLMIARNFDEHARFYTQYSFHNKLPEFLASGTPVFCVAPEWDGTMKIMSENKIGYCVDNDNQDSIAKALYSVFSDYEKAIAIGLKGRKYAVEEYDMDEYRKLLSDKFEDLSIG